VGKDFSNWIKKQIERARLVEGRDFIAITGSPKRANGEFNPKPSVDYYLTIEAAKHIAMMSGCFAVSEPTSVILNSGSAVLDSRKRKPGRG